MLLFILAILLQEMEKDVQTVEGFVHGKLSEYRLTENGMTEWFQVGLDVIISIILQVLHMKTLLYLGSDESFKQRHLRSIITTKNKEIKLLSTIIDNITTSIYNIIDDI